MAWKRSVEKKMQVEGKSWKKGPESWGGEFLLWPYVKGKMLKLKEMYHTSSPANRDQ